jgi:acyl carrier protein
MKIIMEKKEKLKHIMASVFDIPVETIQDSSTMDSLDGWDSLKNLTLIMTLEEEFNIELNEDQIVQLTTFENILITLCR